MRAAGVVCDDASAARCDGVGPACPVGPPPPPCGSLPPLKDATWSCSEPTPTTGASCRATCNTGFVGAGYSTSCRPDGSWAPPGGDGCRPDGGGGGVPGGSSVCGDCSVGGQCNSWQGCECQPSPAVGGGEACVCSAELGLAPWVEPPLDGSQQQPLRSSCGWAVSWPLRASAPRNALVAINFTVLDSDYGTFVCAGGSQASRVVDSVVMDTSRGVFTCPAGTYPPLARPASGPTSVVGTESCTPSTGITRYTWRTPAPTGWMRNRNCVSMTVRTTDKRQYTMMLRLTS